MSNKKTPSMQSEEIHGLSSDFLVGVLKEISASTPFSKEDITVINVIQSSTSYVCIFKLKMSLSINNVVLPSETIYALKIYSPKSDGHTTGFGLNNEIEALSKLQDMLFIPKVIASTNRSILMVYVSNLALLNFELLNHQAENPNIVTIFEMLRSVATELDKIFETVIHCDPSSGNLLVRRQDSGELVDKVVLLDWIISVIKGQHYPAPFLLSTGIWPLGEQIENISLLDFIFNTSIRDAILGKLQQFASENEDEQYYQLYKSFMSIAWAFFLFNACFKEQLPKDADLSSAVPLILGNFSFNVDAINQIKGKLNLNDTQVKALNTACTEIAGKIKQLVEGKSILEIKVEEIIDLLSTAFSESES